MVRMYIYALLCLIAPTVSFSQAGKGNIKGTVTTSDHQPATAVTVQVKRTTKITTTNNDGQFGFDNLPSGDYDVEISYVGYSKLTKHAIVETEKTTTIDFQLVENALQLSEILVSSNKRSYISGKASSSLRLNADLIEVPQNITFATKQSLIDMGLLAKTEIYRLSSGISKSYGSNMDMTVFIRGTNSTYNIYRNGIGGPVWWNAQEDAAMIERLEFVKGPAGFVLANSEPGGLINTVTKQPTHHRIAEIGMGTGSWNLMRMNADFGGEFKKEGKLTYRINAGGQKNNEYYQFGEFTRYFVAPVLKYDFDEKTSLTIETNYVNAQAQENTHSAFTINGKYWALPTDLAINDPNNDKWIAHDLYNRIFLRHQLNKNWSINLQAGYMSTSWKGRALYIESLSQNHDTLFRTNSSTDWSGKLYNAQLFVDGQILTGKHLEHKVLLGLDYGDGKETSDFTGTYGEGLYPLALATPTYYLPKDDLELNRGLFHRLATNSWQAVYVQDHLKVSGKLIITIAGRYTRLTTGQDWNNPPADPKYELTENKFTPRLGLTYLFTNHLSVYVLHDESFLPQRGAIFDGDRLPPLTGRNNEAGVKALFFNQQLAITGSIFNIIKNDVATADPVHPGFYLQTGQIKSKGIDLDLAGVVNPNIYINANYSIANARITKDEDETLIGLVNGGSVKNLANFWVKYQVNSGLLNGFGIGGGYQYTGPRSTILPGYNSFEGNKFMPAYSLFDAALSYSTGSITIGLNVYNLCNKKIAISGLWRPDLNETSYDIEPPRNFRFQTSIRL